MSNNFGRDSVLYIKAKAVDGITILADSFFTAPYKIAKPFFSETNSVLNIVLMSASAGIMEEDCYQIKINLGSGSKVALHGQSYNKIHRMKQGHASQFNTFILEDGAFFDYVQKPTIPFADSRFGSTSECYLHDNSAFLYSEVLACGREKMGEHFAFKEYKNCCRVYYHGEIIFLDNQMYLPSYQSLDGIGFFEGYTHQATLAYFCDRFEDKLLDDLYGILESIQGIDFGLSKTNDFGLIVRILGHSSDKLEKILLCLREEIYRMVQN